MPFHRRNQPAGSLRQSYVQRLIDRAEHLSFENLIATATAFTAYSIADSYKRFIMPEHGLDRVVVSGGGARNKTLLSYPNPTSTVK